MISEKSLSGKFNRALLAIIRLFEGGQTGVRRKFEKSRSVCIVTPAKAGVQSSNSGMKCLDSGLHRNDGIRDALTFAVVTKGLPP